MRIAKTKLLGGTLVFAACLLAASIGLAQGHAGHDFDGPPPPPHEGFGPGGHRGPGGPLGPLMHDLDLTDAQKAQVKQLVDNFMTTTRPLHEQLFKAGGGPFDALKDGAFDEAAVRAAAQARANIQVELEVAHARLMSQIYALLTPEQKAKLAERRQQFEQRRRQHDGQGDAPTREQ